MEDNLECAVTPEISIIMPVYNCVRYLDECLSSIKRQSFRNFELIIVDDGSSDGTLELVEQYAERNNNVTVLRQSHQFAGVARNAGLEVARGKFVIFLDGDDVFRPELLERMHEAIVNNAADVSVCRAVFLDDKTGEITHAPHTCNDKMIPADSVFNRETNADFVFSFTSAAPWNKMYRREYLDSKQLRFQDTRSANDLKFVMSSLAQADRIAAISDELVVYRRNNESSLQATQSKDPLAFYRALEALREELERVGLFSSLERQYCSLAFGNCIYNLKMLPEGKAQKFLFDFLKREGFESLKIEGKSRGYFYNQPNAYLDIYDRMCEARSYKSFARKMTQRASLFQRLHKFLRKTGKELLRS